MTNLLSSPSLEACSLISSSPTSTICSLFLQLSSLHLRSLSLISVNRFEIKVEFSVFVLNKNCTDSVNCIMCDMFFCTVTQLWLKLWLKTNMLPASRCIELGRNLSPGPINGTLAPPNRKLQHRPKHLCECISIITILQSIRGLSVS